MIRRQLRRPARWLMVGAIPFVMLAVDVSAQGEADEDTPESPAVGPQRIIESQPFVGRFGREYTNWGEQDYPRLVGVTSNLR
ncbi:MAG: hypothetical protein VX255_15935, partial [Candidatus Latescibacterota bacterium]|nr:hypothetical protein [Candidatus Latescibacterota bacterium]